MQRKGISVAMAQTWQIMLVCQVKHISIFSNLHIQVKEFLQ